MARSRYRAPWRPPAAPRAAHVPPCGSAHDGSAPGDEDSSAAGPLRRSMPSPTRPAPAPPRPSRGARPPRGAVRDCAPTAKSHAVSASAARSRLARNRRTPGAHQAFELVPLAVGRDPASSWASPAVEEPVSPVSRTRVIFPLPSRQAPPPWPRPIHPTVGARLAAAAGTYASAMVEAGGGGPGGGEAADFLPRP